MQSALSLLYARGRGRPAGHGDLLTYEEILRVIEVFARNGISKVRLTGGEPLVRKGVVDLIKGIAALAGIKDLSLTTNGVLLAEYAGALARAGLRRINVSLDTLRPERFAYITRRDKFKEVWAGIEAALSHGLTPVKVNVVVIQGFNDDEIKDFARLSLAYPLHVRFIEYMPMGQGEDVAGQGSHPLRTDYGGDREVGELRHGGHEEDDGPAKRYYLAGGQGEIGFISPISSHFCDAVQPPPSHAGGADQDLPLFRRGDRPQRGVTGGRDGQRRSRMPCIRPSGPSPKGTGSGTFVLRSVNAACTP